jgi:hypothetical protein
MQQGAAGSLARVASTLSRPASGPPRVLREGDPGPAQRSSNHPPPKGVADFRSERPTSNRNHRPTSSWNGWPTSVGIRTHRGEGSARAPGPRRAPDPLGRGTRDQAQRQDPRRRHALRRPGPAAPGRVPLGPRSHSARSQEPQPLRRFACAWPLLRPRPARRRRPPARGRLRLAAAADLVSTRITASQRRRNPHSSFGSTEAGILPSRPADGQSAARQRGPGGRAAAPALRAGAQRPGRREHGARLEWSGRRRSNHRTRLRPAAHKVLAGG